MAKPTLGVECFVTHILHLLLPFPVVPRLWCRVEQRRERGQESAGPCFKF